MTVGRRRPVGSARSGTAAGASADRGDVDRRDDPGWCLHLDGRASWCDDDVPADQGGGAVRPLPVLVLDLAVHGCTIRTAAQAALGHLHRGP